MIVFVKLLKSFALPMWIHGTFIQYFSCSALFVSLLVVCTSFDSNEEEKNVKKKKQTNKQIQQASVEHEQQQYHMPMLNSLWRKITCMRYVLFALSFLSISMPIFESFSFFWPQIHANETVRIFWMYAIRLLWSGFKLQ